MKIIINENTYIKILSEALGVPKNILQVAEEVYELLIINLLKDKNEIINNNKNKHIFLDKKFIIGNKIFRSFLFDLSFKYSSTVKNINLYSLAFSFENIMKKPNLKQFHLHVNSSTINYKMDFALSNNDVYTITDIIHYLQKNKAETISSLSHELLHTYEKYNKRTDTLPERAEYDASRNIRFNVKPLDDLSYKIYFLSKIENATRPTQIASLMKSHKITKSEFEDFLKKDKIYEEILKIKNFSFENFKSDLLKHKYDILSLISKLSKHDRENIIINNDQDIINIALRIFLITFVNKQYDIYINTLGLNNPLNVLFTDTSEEEEVINNFAKNYLKYNKNIDKYFVLLEKRFKFVASNLLRRIHKIYDMALDVKDDKKTIFDKTTINENDPSIINMDVYRKINRKKMGKISYNPKFKKK